MRLFIGVKTGCEEYLEALQRQLKKLGGGNYTRRENLHMTLEFLGEVPPHKAQAICGALGRIRLGRFMLFCEGVQAFGRDILSAKVGGELGRLSALHDEVERALIGCGFEPERRPFKPHITLVRRFRPSGAFDAAAVDATRNDFCVDKVILFESTREAEKLVYKPLFTHFLEP